ncbi:MAG TPA: hypothetical protein VGQ47_02180 [Candidatus Limnocylindrales bacterium]|nr:hypothetical protein [Candidatus Limnocylindrales bacterium]
MEDIREDAGSIVTAVAREAAAARPVPFPLGLERLGLPTWAIPVGLGLLAAIVYGLTRQGRVDLDVFVPLASEGFLHGRLYLVEERTWFSEVIPRLGGGWYVPYPPVPALAVVPFVLVVGEMFDQGSAAAIYGGANVALLWILLARIAVPPRTRTLLTLGFAFGTVHWWAAGTGDAWPFAQVVAVTFSLLGLIFAVRREHPILAGICLGLAAGSRLPIGLTFPLYVALYAGLSFPVHREQFRRERFVPVARFLSGLAMPFLLLAAYNVARFGDPIDFGYDRIPGVLQEPWFSSGILSLDYIPRHIHAMLLRSFDFVEEPPWFRPNWTSTSLLITTPVYLWLIKARSRRPLVAYGWLAVALALVPIMTHGSVGFSQFGYRFSLDVAAILWLLLGWVFRRGLSREAVVAIALGIAVNAYGVWAVTEANFVSY